MAVQLTKDSIDLGIVVKDADKSLAFYRDTLGFSEQGQMPMGGGSTMYRLLCGSSMIKLVHHAKTPAAQAAPGGIGGGTGYRYWTMSVSNLAEMVAACEAAGYKVAMPETSLGGTIKIAMIEDPDGNWVEFLQTS